MKIKEGFVLRNLCGERIVSAEGLNQIDCNKLIVLNETAAYLWEEIEGKEFTEEYLADLLVDRYEVVREIALADCKKLVNDWREAGLVDD